VTGPVEIELPIYTRWTTIPPLTVEQKKAARDRYVDLRRFGGHLLNTS
jgi:hypothetical protein